MKNAHTELLEFLEEETTEIIESVVFGAPDKNRPTHKNRCKYYYFQRDSGGDIAIEFCNNPQNTESTEGNCRMSVCPILRR